MLTTATTATTAQLGHPLDDLRLRQRKCLIQREYYMKQGKRRADYRVLGALRCPLFSCWTFSAQRAPGWSYGNAI